MKSGVFSVFCLLMLSASASHSQQKDSLYQGFKIRPLGRPMPIWYWNSEIQAEEAKRQIDEYIKQGAHGAAVYPAIGLRTRFLSEEWWRVWAEILPYGNSSVQQPERPCYLRGRTNRRA